MGEFVARNMLGWFKKINKRKSCCILLLVYHITVRSTFSIYLLHPIKVVHDITFGICIVEVSGSSLGRNAISSEGFPCFPQSSHEYPIIWP